MKIIIGSKLCLECHLCKWQCVHITTCQNYKWCYFVLSCILYADECALILRLSEKYSAGTGRGCTKERNQILHLCMDELNPDYREALYLTYFEGMSYQQAAEVMGKSVKQITNMVYRGKERLRGLLKREGITNAER